MSTQIRSRFRAPIFYLLTLSVSLLVPPREDARGEDLKITKRLAAGFPAHTETVEIKSSRFPHTQLAYFFKASIAHRPLLVSLHSWGGNYTQPDALAILAESNDWNYIHPDYGGVQWNGGSCCFPEAVQDIDDAAAYALKAGRADAHRIAFIGKSGGGSAVLAAYLQSGFDSAWYFAWSPIPDYASWYDEVQNDPDLKLRYSAHLFTAAKSTEVFNRKEAERKSPQHFDLSRASYPKMKKLRIYSGVRDGLEGWSTSLLQPLLFYNKLLEHLPNVPRTAFVDAAERQALVAERRAPLAEQKGKLGAKEIVHHERYRDIELYVFNGGHEMIDARAAEDLQEAFQ